MEQGAVAVAIDRDAEAEIPDEMKTVEALFRRSRDVEDTGVITLEDFAAAGWDGVGQDRREQKLMRWVIDQREFETEIEIGVTGRITEGRPRDRIIRPEDNADIVCRDERELAG